MTVHLVGLEWNGILKLRQVLEIFNLTPYLPHSVPDGIRALESGGRENGEAELPEGTHCFHLLLALYVHLSKIKESMMS